MKCEVSGNQNNRAIKLSVTNRFHDATTKFTLGYLKML